MKRNININGKTYEIAENSINEGVYTFAIEDGMYNYNTIKELERAGLSCHIDKSEGNELVCRSETPIVINEVVE